MFENKFVSDGKESPVYTNKRGWRYSISEEIGYNEDYDKVAVYSVKYHKAGKWDLHSARDMAEPRYTREEAENDLRTYAEKRGLILVG